MRSVAHSAPGHLENGQVVLDQPVDWPEGTPLVVRPEVSEFRGDGRAWPKTLEEIEAWCREVEELPALFATEEQIERFERAIRQGRDENRLRSAAWLDELAKLAP